MPHPMRLVEILALKPQALKDLDVVPRGASNVSILVTGLRGIPGVMGGVETHCEELLPRVTALDPSLTITVAGRSPYLPGLAAEGSNFRGVRVIPLWATRGTSTEAATGTFSGVIYAWRSGASLVHIHAIGPALLTPLARMVGMRVIVTHHGKDYDRAKWGGAAKLMLKLGEAAAMRFAHSIIAVSPSLAADLKERFPTSAEKVHYIPNGAPELGGADEDAAATLESFGLEAGNYILTVGRLVPEKGADYLIRAFRRSGSQRKLVIVGGADHESAYATEIVREADDNVRFLGLQSRSVLRQLYDHAALFVLPSFHEGLPICALEAGRCGAPMLLSNIPANKDIGLPDHHYFPVGDEAALAAALVAPAEGFAVDRAALSARFDWDSIAEATSALYRSTLSAGRER